MTIWRPTKASSKLGDGVVEDGGGGNGLDGRRAFGSPATAACWVYVTPAPPLAPAPMSWPTDEPDERDRGVEPATGHRREVAADAVEGTLHAGEERERVLLVEVERREQRGTVRAPRGSP